jgi:hypothetical protein
MLPRTDGLRVRDRGVVWLFRVPTEFRRQREQNVGWHSRLLIWISFLGDMDPIQNTVPTYSPGPDKVRNGTGGVVETANEAYRYPHSDLLHLSTSVTKTCRAALVMPQV